MSYTKDKRVELIPPIQSTNREYINNFQGKAMTFRNILFPTPPSIEPPNWDNYEPGDWTWPDLSEIELNRACSAKIKGTIPGSDYITQVIITKAYQAIPDHFLQLYQALLDIGHHPTCWKQAIGVILKKPRKLDYSLPKAYKVISLLNYLGKVSERILAQRLAYLAETLGLLYNS
jgi:hypothetical protein